MARSGRRGKKNLETQMTCLSTPKSGEESWLKKGRKRDASFLRASPALKRVSLRTKVRGFHHFAAPKLDEFGTSAMLTFHKHRLMCFMVYCVPLPSHCPVECATTPEPSAPCPYDCDPLDARTKGLLRCSSGHPSSRQFSIPLMLRSRSLNFAETESRSIIVRVARLGMERRRVKES
jgi:hypothetical protein